MQNKFLQITLMASLLLGCTKENLNDCDQASPVFKTIKADFTPVINNNIVTFKNNSLNAESYSWEFGDGTTSTVFEPNKQFAYRDTPYTVKLTTSRCGGERVATVSQSVDIKCTTKAPIIEVDKKTICAGEVATLKLQTPCASGSSIKWSTGATTNTIAVAATGKYTAQCVTSCTSAASNEIEVTVNAKPNQPSILGTTFEICEGIPFTLPNSTCNIGTLIWNDGTTGFSKTPSANTNYTVTCNSNSCVSSPSSSFSFKIISSKATVATLDGSETIISNNITFRGSIDYKTNNTVEDHGFIYKTGLTDTPFKIGDVGVTTISMGSRPVSTVNTFNRVLTKPAKDISFIAYIKDCSGYKYGTIKKL